MSTFQYSLPLSDSNGSSNGFLDAVGKLVGSLTRAQQANRALHSLNALSDDALARRGMTRQDIPAAVHRVLVG